MNLRLRPLLIASAVLVLSLAITLVLWRHERQNTERDRKANLEFNLREATSRIEQHMAAYEQMVRGVNGFFAGSEHPSRSAFQAYVNSLELGPDFSGIQEIGMTTIILPSELASHTASMRQSGLASYQVYPQGARETYTPVVQIQPPNAGTFQTLGFDPFADPLRRKAMVRAAESGSASISRSTAIAGHIDGVGRADCIMYLPLYRHGAAAETPAQRQQAIVGWSFASLRISDLMASLYGGQRDDIEISLHDSVERSPDSLLYQSVKTGIRANPLEAIEYLAIGGTTWVLTVSAGSNFVETAGYDQSKIILVSGILLSCLSALVCWQMLTAKDYALTLAHDMTYELRKSEELAHHLAQHDTLTGLPNRALFSDRLTQALSLARRDSTRLALFYIDVDNFKPINDAHGHAVGDTVLQTIAERLSEAIRDSDTAGRIGGDEFVVLLPVISSNDNVQTVGTKILESVSAPIHIAGQTHYVSASIGIATFPEHGHDEVSLFKAADQAMYHAKANHRNCLLWAT